MELVCDDSGPVECLGQKFPSDQARREHYLKLLAEKLKEPAFRQQVGFPKGTDEAILAMSDPPYYTACPNPWLTEFVRHYGKPYDPSVKYSREPLAIDVSVGKTDVLYKAHAYHTKVPHLAIVPSILHYTQPGDVVFDGFSGSGMTGVAAQWCETAPASFRHQLELAWRAAGRAAPKWGARKAVLNDLSPAASFIAANYNLPFDIEEFSAAGEKLLSELQSEIGWMYETTHSDGKTKGRIEYTVWAQLYGCPECSGELNFTEEALDNDTKRVKEEFPCPHCGAELTKPRLTKLYTSKLDKALGRVIQTPRRAATIISYVVRGQKFEKKPDADDMEVLRRIDEMEIPLSVPKIEIPRMHMTHERARMDYAGVTHIHHFFLPRAAQALGRMWQKANDHTNHRTRLFLLFMVEQAIWGMSVLNRYKTIMHGKTQSSNVNQYLSGVYYVASQHSEVSPWYNLENRLGRLSTKAFASNYSRADGAVVTVGSAARNGLAESSVDYIFTDPPFGENIYYSDLNFLVESWHGVTTDSEPEAIIDRCKNKALPEYQRLMQECFSEYHRVLKPGRWMTVVFSNSKAAVWNAIQVALQQAGFVVAEVTALDKVQGSYRQVTSTTAVKQDLVISAYKPDGDLEERLALKGATPDSAWDFVQSHLAQLSVVKVRDGELEFIVERDPRRVYDRLIAWFIRHDAPVPLSSDEFLSGMRSRFPERDGMVFLPDQVAAYDRKRAQVTKSPQMDLFVSDERSAIDWLSDFLKSKPSTYQELHPDFITQVGAGWKKHEAKPELSALLENNFLKYDGTGEVPSQIHTYLSSNYREFRGLEKSDPALRAKAQDRWFVPDPNKAQDLEKKREKALLKEFDGYVAATGRKLKEFRLEVLRAGFKTAWASRDYQTIIKVAQKIPEEALQEDEKLLLWYDQALTRVDAAS
ncbi:DNA methylase [Mitsuaria sp. WAJ17]|uniref:DNA methyltransferase n=1 Tax=Mitsuaria sp. WAJ17 TaxID=2761452 RepID=UPI001603358B|nr:DNA methyltransferase [Mitsuaria sp. WAJ17]MBB2484848.1 DNA methylase [Mitsuaria sp. WAJ17]